MITYLLLLVLFFFFFKQKTSYELRISDWSSDVCSSDLLCQFHAIGADAIHGKKASKAVHRGAHPANRAMEPALWCVIGLGWCGFSPRPRRASSSRRGSRAAARRRRCTTCASPCR